MKKRTQMRARSKKTRRKRVKRKSVRRSNQKGGACLPCLGIPPIAKALGLTALGSLAIKNSSVKKTRSGENYKTTLKKRLKNQKLKKVVITLTIKGDRATLKKNNKEIKIRGDPTKQYQSLIKSCESNGFDKC